MVDPSLLFAEEASDWLVRNPLDRSRIVVPATLVEWARTDLSLGEFGLIAPEDTESDPAVRELILDSRAFSYREVEEDLPPVHNEVLFNLLRAGDVPPFVGRLRADEWAFLQSHSILLSKLRNPLDTFRDAGSAIVEFGRNVGWKIVRKVIPPDQIPPVLSSELVARAAVKWIIVGGTAIGGGTLGGMAGTAVAGPVGAWIGSKAGGLMAEEAARAAVLAVDP